MTMEYRAATLEAVTDRTITLLVAPYGTDTHLGGGVRERITRGAFGEPDPTKVVLKLETAANHQGPVIGRAMAFTETDAGLEATFKVSATQAGDDALVLAADGAVGASAGMMILDASPDRDGVMELRRADLREVTLTGTPAYQEATVLAVRSAQEGTDMNETDTTTVEVTPAAVDVEAMVADAVTRAVDVMRTQAVEQAAVPAIQATHRGHAYRSLGEVIVDMNLHARGKSPEASERLTQLIDTRQVSADGSTLDIITRAAEFPGVGNSVGSGVPNNYYLPELMALLREGRPTADLFIQRPLPAEGNTIQTPKVTQGSTVDYQDGEGTQVSNQVVNAILEDWKKSTLAGGQGMTLQAIAWGNPSYADMVVSDLLAAYTETLDLYTIVGDPAVDTPVSNTGFLGILNAGATDVPVAGDMTAAVALVGSAWAAVFAGSKRAPIAAVMNSREWGEGLNQVDADGRPIITDEAPSNPAGFGNAASVSGTFRGLPVVIDDNVPVGNIIVGSFRDAYLFSDPINPAQVSLTFPSTLVTDVTVYGFNALAIRRPAAFAVLSGIVPS
jgi:HK97 family phage prohead protease